MKVKEKRLKVAMFSGGRGTASISEAFSRHPEIDLSILVNCYDDGLSTGALRRYIPKMLGPSDVRKNITRLIESDPALSFLLEYRLPSLMEQKAVEILTHLYERRDAHLPGEFYDALERVSVLKSRQIREYVGAFLEYRESMAGGKFEFSDCSFGNVLFAGCFLKSGTDFNRTVREFEKFCGSKGRVLNLTRGEPYVLVGVKADGSLLKNEAEIVSKQNRTSVADLYLLETYLTEREEREFSELRLEGKLEFLKSRSRTPLINPEIEEILRQADIIIYGPGTQHSSLFPSYLTKGITEAITDNPSADKIFISNIRKDHEIQSETINSLVKKFYYFLSRKGELSVDPKNLVNHYFFQEATSEEYAEDYVAFEENTFDGNPGEIKVTNWEDAPGAHSGGRVLNELVALVNERAQARYKPFPYMVSIVVPGLNEEKTVGKVLHDLVLLNFQPFGLGKEVIFVDGGSTDQTYEIAKKESAVRCFQLEGEKGRGSALRFGASKAKGNIVVFFPSDDEYAAQDLFPIVNAIASSENRAVFGSRMIKCVNLSGRIKDIYKGDYLGYLVSKYGGMSLSVMSLLLFNRFISDPLTGVKAFDSHLLSKLQLKAKGVELETEIIAKLSLFGEYVFEMPIGFRPRKRSEGKKVTVWDGLRTLFNLFRLRLKTSEKTVRSYSRV